jgi:prevent-host-death family protein
MIVLLDDHHDQLGGGTMTRRKAINIAVAKARLPELVERAARGEEIVIARNGTPRARLVPLEAAKRRVPGHGAGKWKIAGDFNAPLPADLLAAFEGRAK